MTKKVLSIMALSALFFAHHVSAQEEVVKDSITILQEQIQSNQSDIKSLKKFKVSGYVQAQMEVVGKDGKSKTGQNTGFDPSIDGTDSHHFLRYGLRRSRIKFQYTENIAKAVFELDITEGGVKPKNAFIQVDPCKWLSLQAGLVTLWYGHEVAYSSSELEVLERSKFLQDLFPDEKDLALRATFKGLKNTFTDGFKLDLGVVSGGAINKTPNGKVNFLGRLSYGHSTSSLEYGLGVSYYHGKTNNANNLWYEIQNDVWSVEDSSQANTRHKRQYFGIDGQVSFETLLGLTAIRAEYTLGTQPSQKSGLKSPNGNEYNSSDAFAYNRKFTGAYIYLIQDIYTLPFSAVLKWAYVDNNTDISGDKVTNKADLAYNDFGFGLMWRINPQLRLTAMFDYNKNETSSNIAKYSDDIADNVFTMRLQYKF